MARFNVHDRDRYYNSGHELFKDKFLRGRLLMEENGIKLRDIQYGSKGKPFIPGAQHFNLSHSGEYFMLITGDSPVGCDIQEHSFGKSLKFFHDWVLRESISKCHGTGLGQKLPQNQEMEENFFFCNIDKEIYFTKFIGDVEGYSIAITSTDEKVKFEKLEINTNSFSV